MRSYVRVDVDIDDVMDEIDTDDLIAELRRRKVAPTGSVAMDMGGLRNAYDALMANRPNDALAILSGLLFPKFKDAAECALALEQAPASLFAWTGPKVRPTQ